jgi:hypothetical protein
MQHTMRGRQPTNENLLRSSEADQRRALELLASCRDGCTETIMLAHGFTVEQMAKLVRAGPATATAQRVVAGAHIIDVVTLRLPRPGRRALKQA